MYDVLLVANTTVRLCHVYFSRCTRVRVRVRVYTLEGTRERRTVELFVKTKKRKKLNKLIYFISSLSKLDLYFIKIYFYTCFDDVVVSFVAYSVIFFFSNVQVYVQGTLQYNSTCSSTVAFSTQNIKNSICKHLKISFVVIYLSTNASIPFRRRI